MKIGSTYKKICAGVDDDPFCGIYAEARFKREDGKEHCTRVLIGQPDTPFEGEVHVVREDAKYAQCANDGTDLKEFQVYEAELVMRVLVAATGPNDADIQAESYAMQEGMIHAEVSQSKQISSVDELYEGFSGDECPYMEDGTRVSVNHILQAGRDG